MFGRRPRMERDWHARLRAGAAGGSACDPGDCPPDLLTRLSATDPDLHRYLAAHPGTPAALLDTLARVADKDTVRAAAANPSTSVVTLAYLVDTGSASMRLRVAMNPNATATLLDMLADDADGSIVGHVVGRAGTPLDTLRRVGARRHTANQAGSRYAISVIATRMRRAGMGMIQSHAVARALVLTGPHVESAEVIAQASSALAAMSPAELACLDTLMTTLPRDTTFEALAGLAVDMLALPAPETRTEVPSGAEGGRVRAVATPDRGRLTSPVDWAQRPRTV